MIHHKQKLRLGGDNPQTVYMLPERRGKAPTDSEYVEQVLNTC